MVSLKEPIWELNACSDVTLGVGVVTIPYHNYMLINIHTHFSSSPDNMVSVVQSNPEDVLNSSGLYSSGIHPWDTNRLSESDLEMFMANLTMLFDRPEFASKRPFAIGECGLDKLRGASMDYQIYWFKKQIELSEIVRKPLLIHCVKAWDELLLLHKQIHPHMPWIIHGFRGKPQLAGQLLSKTNIFLSFGVNFNTETLLITPLSKLFIETDDIEYDLQSLYYTVANERNIPLNELISQIECNFVSLNL